MRIREYQRDGSDDDSSDLEADQQLFLIAARQFNLRIMIDLFISPAQSYYAMLQGYARDYCKGKMTWEQFLDFLPDWKTVESAAKSAPRISLIRAFQDSLLNWSIRWHLDADWCRDRAIAAMRLWLYSKGAKRYFCWDSFDFWNCVQERLKIIDQLCEDEQEFVRSLASDPKAFGIRVSRSKSERPDGDEFSKLLSEMPKPKSKLLPPNIFMKPLGEYLDIARLLLEDHPLLSSFSEAKRRKTIIRLLAGPARDYHAEWEHHFKSCGWKPSHQQPEHLKHLLWAVSHQVGGIECSQITAGPPLVEINTVSKAVARILKQLGFRNRQGRGRPSRKVIA
jgi:hypothetical protein